MKEKWITQNWMSLFSSLEFYAGEKGEIWLSLRINRAKHKLIMYFQ